MPNINLTQALKVEYLDLFKTLEVNQNRFDDVDNIVDKILPNKGLYKNVSQKVNAPWFFIAAIHNMESGVDLQRFLNTFPGISLRVDGWPGDRTSVRSTKSLAFIWRVTPDPVMHRTLSILLLLLCLEGCAENTKSVPQVHTTFSESSGLTVTYSTVKSQQLIAESLAVRVVASPSGQWIMVEDMKLSNLVVLRAFRYDDGSYRELTLPAIRRQWETFARKAGIRFENLIHPRVGIEEFGPRENMVLLHFQADTGLKDQPEIDSIVEIRLDTDIE